MSDRVGPMAWGSQGMVFLGEDLMHSRDYSEETSRVIDEEVERILREQEERATQFLTRHKEGLKLVAASLLEKETIDGGEVARLVDTAYGRPVHGDGAAATVPHFASSDDGLPPNGRPELRPRPRAPGETAPAGAPPGDGAPHEGDVTQDNDRTPLTAEWPTERRR